jgi:ABC-2 type transport system ATP-binding protein
MMSDDSMGYQPLPGHQPPPPSPTMRFDGPDQPPPPIGPPAAPVGPPGARVTPSPLTVGEIDVIPPGSPRSDLVVEARGLTKHYGTLRALDHVDLDIPKGSIFGIIGPNGAGKSTAFLILATLLTPTAGWARVCGFSPMDEPEEVRRRMGYMPDVMGVYENLTVKEYLEFHAATYHIDKREWPALVDGLLELVDLDVKRVTIVDDLSRGMKQRLSLARALIHDPELLILDEPASGLDPRARIELRELLLQLQEMGKTIVISSHILAELQQMCDAIGVIEAGRLLASGPPDQILARLGVGRSVRVRFGDGSVDEFPVGSDDEQQALLRKLIVDDNRQVLEFTTVNKNLEDLFLQITKGIVQ